MISRFRPTRAQGLAHFGGGPVRGRERGGGLLLTARPTGRRQQATVQTELLNKLNIAVGNKPSGSVAKGSNAVKNAAMLGGAAALMKLNQISQDTAEISEDTSEISEGFEGFGGF